MKINFNSKLVSWFFTHFFGFFISYLIVDNLFSSISNKIIISLILGLGVYGFTKIYQKFMFKKRTKFYFSSIPFWVWILLIVILLIVSSHVYVTYETKKISSNSLYCEDGNLYQKNGLMDFISSMTIEIELGISCIEYKTSRCKPSCVNENPVCKCQATIWNMIFSSRNPFGVFE